MKTATKIDQFAQPQEVGNVTASFGAGRDVFGMMPAYKDIPDEFKKDSNPFVQLQQEWFFSGLKTPIVTRPGIDRNKALAHLAAIQRSFEPSHEHKEAGVAYLMSLWFESPK